MENVEKKVDYRVFTVSSGDYLSRDSFNYSVGTQIKRGKALLAFLYIREHPLFIFSPRKVTFYILNPQILKVILVFL